jgi:hypothetical protein
MAKNNLRKNLSVKNNIVPEKTLFLVLSLMLAGLIVMKLVYAATPNPGHDFAQVSGGVAQGDILFGSAPDILSNLPKDTNATRYLSNTGTDNNPAWAQVNLSNGVTENLPVGNLASGSNASSTTFWRGDGSWQNPNYRAVVGGGSSTSITADAVCNPNGYSVCNTTRTTMFGLAMPYNVEIKNLYGTVQTAPAAGSSCAFTVRSSASCTGAYTATSLSCTVTGDGSTRNCSDTSDSPTISAGDCIQIHYDETGTCSGIINWGFEVSAQ